MIGEKAFVKESEYGFSLRQKSIQEVVLPETVVAIKDYAFEYCIRLKKIRYSGNLRMLGEGVFQACQKLEGFSLPEGMTEIPDNLFSYCSSLKEI